MKELFTILKLLLDSLFGANRTNQRERKSPEIVPDQIGRDPAPARDDRLEPERAPDPVLPDDEYGPAFPLVRAMQRKGYKVFKDNREDLNLNIVGVRNTSAGIDEYGCTLYVFWKTSLGPWAVKSWPITTYPGSRYLVERLLNPRGAAILKPGQYKGIYKLDLHGGRYEALCQRNGPVTVYRDGDRDHEFDILPSSTMTGYFGINIHSPVSPDRLGHVAQRVYSSSAGCQVFQKVTDFVDFIELCQSAEELWGNRFTYTLLNDIDVEDTSTGPDDDESQDSPTLKFRAGHKIVELEARRDASGNLIVYKLPANDGGGTHEVAGLNSRYHPEILAKLVRMSAEDREPVAAEYIETYTRRMTGFVVRSIRAGTEFFVLDSTFNRGGGGSAWIVQKALRNLGFVLALDSKWGPVTRGKLEEADRKAPEAIVTMLRRAREEYEQTKVGYRANFWNGLVNRWNKAAEIAHRLNNE